MTISADAFLAANPKPTVDQVRVGLSGKLCRCAGCRQAVDAVRTAAGRRPAMTGYQSPVGASVAKIDSREKVLGTAKYIADLKRPNMLHAAMLQSPHAHARILSYDTSKAEQVPGVRCVLTGDDFKDCKMGAFFKDEGPIAKGKVRYFGEPVAVIAAEDEATARAAVKLISVDYEELSAILSPEEALADGAPLVHEDLASYTKIFEAKCQGNQLTDAEISQGDIEQGFAECDVIVEGKFQTQAQYHLSVEPCGALAELNESGRVHLWSANQSVFRVQANVCESLGLPMSKVRSMTPRVGAGFGNKMEAHVQPMTVALALATGRPVRMILSREEDFETVRARHPVAIRMKTGAQKDGTFVAREFEVLMDCGAYADDSPGVMGFMLNNACGPYRFPNARAHGKLVYTNKLRFGAFRGFGNPQVTFASESQINEIAEKIGMDPIEIRLKNGIRAGDRWFGGQVVASSGFKECLEKVRDASGWRRRSHRTSPPGKTRGYGIAACAHTSGILATSAIVRMLEDGTFVLNTGVTDIGQGSDTVLTQICAEALKVPMENVVFAAPDTDGSPYNWGTTASRVTHTTGRAVVGAAAAAVGQIMDHAAAILEESVDKLELREGGLVGVKGANRAVPFVAIAARSHWEAGGPIIGSKSLVYDKASYDLDRARVVGLPLKKSGAHAFCAQVVEVEIDETTGKSNVLRAWIAADVGKAINPALVEGQIEGGFAQGLGMALYEELVWDGPRLVNPSLMDYKAPTSNEVPYEIQSIIVEDPEPDGPYGAKGVGEISLNGVPAAVANAVAEATGIRLRKLPLTPEEVLNGLQNRTIC